MVLELARCNFLINLIISVIIQYALNFGCFKLLVYSSNYLEDLLYLLDLRPPASTQSGGTQVPGKPKRAYLKWNAN